MNDALRSVQGNQMADDAPLRGFAPLKRGRLPGRRKLGLPAVRHGEIRGLGVFRVAQGVESAAHNPIIRPKRLHGEMILWLEEAEILETEHAGERVNNPACRTSVFVTNRGDAAPSCESARLRRAGRGAPGEWPLPFLYISVMYN